MPGPPPRAGQIAGDQLAQCLVCGTSTAASVPCMFSHLGRDGFEAAARPTTKLAGRGPARRPGRAVAGQPGGLQGHLRPRAQRGDQQPEAPHAVQRRRVLDPIMLDSLDARIAALPAGAARQGRGAGDAPDGQPRPGVLQARRRRRSSASCPSAPPTTCRTAAASSWSTPTTTPSPTPTTSWPRHIGWLQQQPVSHDTGWSMCPTTVNRWARTTCTCTACPMPSRPMCRSTCPGSPGCPRLCPAPAPGRCLPGGPRRRRHLARPLLPFGAGPAGRGPDPSATSTDYQANALARCNAQPAADRDACVLRIQGQGRVEGSVNGGGLIRQVETPIK
jgi:hypothetical protein